MSRITALGRVSCFAALLSLSFFLNSTAQAQFAKGADMGWISQQESSGKRFYNRMTGAQQDPFAVIKSQGIDAVRLRVWVNPSGGWCDGADTLYKAKRATAQGAKIMIDFHYSDSWADPGKQTKPAAWANHTIAQLTTDVYNHTWGILNYLKTNGVTADWVQVGNEINSGMLWPEGRYTNFANLARLINSGYNAAKAVNPGSKVIIHLANGQDNGLFRWFFDNLRNNGAKYDVIGMSLYTTSSNWSSMNNQIRTNMNDMISRYGKDIMICEVGMDWQQSAAAKSMLRDLISKVRALGSRGLGVFYWEPLAYPGWQGYTLGAIDAGGKPTQALDAFLP